MIRTVIDYIRSRNVGNTFFYTIGNALPSVITFLLLPIYSRFLSPKDFGYLGYIQSLIVFLSITNSLSLNSYLLRKFYDTEESEKLTSTLFIFLSGIGIVLTLFELLLFYILTLKFGISVPFWPFLVVGMVGFYFTSINLIPLRHIRLVEKAKLYLILLVATTVIENSISIVLITFCKLGAIGKLIGYASTALLMSFIYTFYVVKTNGFSFDYNIVKNGLKFSLPLLPGAYAYVALNMADRIILERFVPMAVVGIYSIAYTIATSGRILATALAYTYEPSILKESRKPTFNNWFVMNKNRTFIIIVIAISPLLFFSAEIVKIFLGPKFITSSIYIPVIAMSVVFILPSTFYSNLILLKDRTDILSVASIVAAILNIALNIVLIPKFGVYAAAGTTLLCYILINLFYFLSARKLYRNIKFDFFEFPMAVLYLALVVYVLKGYENKISYFSIDRLIIFVVSNLMLIIYYRRLNYKISDL